MSIKKHFMEQRPLENRTFGQPRLYTNIINCIQSRQKLYFPMVRTIGKQNNMAAILSTIGKQNRPQSFEYQTCWVFKPHCTFIILQFFYISDTQKSLWIATVSDGDAIIRDDIKSPVRYPQIVRSKVNLTQSRSSSFQIQCCKLL